MDPTRAEVLDWIEAQLATRLTPAAQSDILRATGCDGDDAVDLMAAFARRFGVNMSGYQWDMHHRARRGMLQPGWPLPLRTPHGVPVPLSLTALHLAASTRRWPLTYPKTTPTPDYSWANLPLLAVGLPGLTLLLLWAIPRLF